MTAEQLEQLRDSRAELAALRKTIRREYADLCAIALEATTDTTPAPGGVLYALHAVKQANVDLGTALWSLSALLDETAR